MGKPNIGKSTLLNVILQRKVSIVSPRPATTRLRVMGILTENRGQIVFIDTPGFEETRDYLGKFMHKTILSSMDETQLILFLIDARGWTPGDDKVLRSIKKFGKKTVLGINKSDKLTDRKFLLPLIEENYEKANFADIVPISALKNENIDELINLLFDLLPESDLLFPAQQISNLPERYVVAEIIREKVLLQTYQEVPYSVAVKVEEITIAKGRQPNMLYINAHVYVDRQALKPILIGKNGRKLKCIGTMARIEIENLLGKKIFLDLEVKVIKNWRDKPELLRLFGYA